MGLILAFIAGYVVGARDGSDALDEVIDAAKGGGRVAGVRGLDLIRALRSHAGHVLAELGHRLDPDTGEPLSMESVLGRARDIARLGATWSAS